jgi:hypothetical protein
VFGGRLVETGSTFKFVRYSIARGVSLGGTIRAKDFGPPVVFQGTITIGGARAAHGVLGLSGRSLRGTVGGKIFH